MRSAYAFDLESSTSTTPHASTSTTGTFNANPRSAYVRPSAPALPPPPRNPHRSGLRAASDNRMVYVLAFEDDGHAHDVTWRYDAWWARVVKSVARPYRLAWRSTETTLRMRSWRSQADGGHAHIDGRIQGPPHVRAGAAFDTGADVTPATAAYACFDGVGQPPPHGPAQPSSTNTMTPATWSARTASSPRCAEPAFLNADEYHSPLTSYSDFNDGGDPAVKIEEVHHHLLPHGAPSYMHHPMRQHAHHAHHAHHAPHHQQHPHAHH
ncbi:hypothetical protein C8J57DRAFT_1665209 [Mycena rebaudengoi]|nr:hypothetical protein C8J57DRAFT_1591705 [Mycena rebaudengoi]KAJ7252317.1 hypothetical protein C8J57DRAFT_1665209 [Mycena rebaudengoi]